MEIVGYKDFWKQNKVNESLELKGSNIDNIASKFEDLMNDNFGPIHNSKGHEEYGLDNDGNKISLYKDAEFGPYYVLYGIDTDDNDLNFSITYNADHTSTEDIIAILTELGCIVHENTVEEINGPENLYKISANIPISIEVDFEQVFKDIVAKLKPTVHNITPEQLSMQWGDWVLPEDTSGYVITKILSEDSQDILNKICNQYKLKWSEQEKGYVSIEPK